MNSWKDRVVRDLHRELGLLGKTLWQSLYTLPSTCALDRAAGISYYAVLAVFPFILIVVLVGGRVLRNPALAAQAIQFLSERIPVAGGFLSHHLPQIQDAAGGLGFLSGFGLVWSAMGLFAALRNAMDDLNGTPRKGFLKGHWYSLASVFLTAVGLMICLALSTLLGVFGSLPAVRWLDALIPFLPVVQTVSSYSGQAVSWVALFFLLHFLPTHRPAFRDCFAPAVLLTIAIQIFRIIFMAYLSHQKMNAVHGPLSAAIAFLGWAYASAVLVLWGSYWAGLIQRRRSEVS